MIRFTRRIPPRNITPRRSINLAGSEVRIWPVTLPHHDKVTEADWKRYAGRDGYVSNQGFYLYRNRRLIVHGTWFRLARQLELTKLARVGIDIPNTLDAEWKIDVRKASAQPPAPVRARLQKIIEPLGVPSRRTYTKRGAKLTEDNRFPVWARVQDKNRISYEVNEGHPILAGFSESLDPRRAREFERILRLVASTLPVDALHVDVSANPETVRSPNIATEDLRIACFLDVVHPSRSRGLARSDRAMDAFRRSIPDTVVGDRQRYQGHRKKREGLDRSMNDLDKLKIMVQSLLAQELPTQARIREVITEVRPVCPDVTDIQAEDLALEFETLHGVRMTDGAALQDPGFVPWLDAARAGIDFYYWGRYRRLLAEQGLSSQVLGGIGNVTDRILGFIENPDKPGRWDRRGMVMGHVQSGKTANYIGVVTKAADAGYRVIIIIAGLQNKLRDQTQRRVDEGFIGFSSLAGKQKQLPVQNILGVGRYDARRRPCAFTTSHRDFHKGIAESLNVPLQNLNKPAVFVIKKNPSTLRNLIDWLKIHNSQLRTDTIKEPMLLIDDEADNASINIGHRMDEVSRINGQIRALLNLFDRSNYVGYTATPFANIFVDPDSEDQMVETRLVPTRLHRKPRPAHELFRCDPGFQGRC